MKNKQFCSILALVFFVIAGTSYQAIAQTRPPQRTVSGTVTDALGPITGVNVILRDQNSGTFTDQQGQYQIMASPTDTLIFTYLGYKTMELPVGNRTQIDVKLQEEATALQEVEVNAGYYTVKERERTGSISRVTAEEIEMQPISNPLAALQGRSAGVEIVQSSGVTGAAFEIRIRGRNSIRTEGNDPLYVIDGVPFSSTSLGEQQTSASVIPGGAISPLNNINPSDIESIEILKDADATAIYGSRGANGVVLITTKRGAFNGDTKIEFNFLSGLGNVSHTLDLLDTPNYLIMRNEAFANDGIDPLPSNAYDINGTWDNNRYTDWQKILFGKTSYLTNLQGSISGGNAQTSFMVSGNYHFQSNVFIGDYHNDKVSLLTNLNHRTKDDKLTFQLSIGYTSNQNNLPGTSLVLSALTLPPNAPVLYKEDGNLNWENSTWSNPLRHLEGIYESNTKDLVANTRLNYSLSKHLGMTANLGYTESHVRELKTIPSTIYDPAYGVGPGYSSAIHNVSQRTSWIVEPQLHFGHDLGHTKLKVLAGLSFQEQQDLRLSQLGYGFTSNSLIKNLAAASSIVPITDTKEVYRYNALFGRINLNHRKKYLLNITGRRDGSSRFGPNKRFANFGAIGAAWIFSEEQWIENQFPFLSFGKLRVSYGITGNDKIGDYQYLDTYSFGNAQYQNIVGLYPTRLFNPDFSWETNKKLELAIDIGFFQDRLFISGSYYRNRSANQLVGIPLPGTTGFGSINANLDATVENSGWELVLNTVNFNKAQLKWSTSFNITIPRNRLLAFPNLEGSTYSNQLVIGKPLNIVKLYQLNGVDTQSGLYEFEDFNGDENISAPDDRQAIKNLDPEFFGGLANNLTFKKFRLDVLFQFSKRLGFNYWEASSIPGNMNNQPIAVLQRWQEIGDRTLIQKFSTGRDPEALRAHTNFIQSDATVSNASYVRLKTLSIVYGLANKRNHGFGCEVFLRGQNLWTWTNYKGLDPETQSRSTVPVLRFISLGTQLTF